MSYCSACGKELSEGTDFCPGCGAKVGRADEGTDEAAGGRPETHEGEDWLDFAQLINTSAGMLGTLGVVIAIIAAFLPWANVPVERLLGDMGGFGGPSLGHATVQARSSLAWPIALLAAIGMVTLMKRSTGIVTAVIGILIALYALFSVVILSGGGTSPAPGAFFALLGGAMMAYAGFAIRRA